MKPLLYTVSVGIAMLSPVGCFHPAQTRLPTLQTGPPQVEKRLYERHDPFPDRDMGPQMESRPRGFDLQRAQPRRSAEERTLRGLRRDNGSAARPPSSTRKNYPDSLGY